MDTKVFVLKLLVPIFHLTHFRKFPSIIYFENFLFKELIYIYTYTTLVKF